MGVRPPGFGRARSDHRFRARDVLLDKALQLFVERGYVGVRVEDIARAAGISRATFYKYFSEREEILAELFARLQGSPTPEPPGGATDALVRIATLLSETAGKMTKNERLARFVYTLPIRHAALLGEGARPPVFDAVERLVADGAAAGVIRTDASPAIITAHIARTFEAAMRDWAEGRTADPITHLTLLLDLTFRGLTGATAPD